jgi:hypothetical protein
MAKRRLVAREMNRVDRAKLVKRKSGMARRADCDARKV